MKPNSKTFLGLAASCIIFCSMSAAYGDLLYQWNFNGSDGSNGGTGTGGTLTANVGTPTDPAPTGSFSQTGVSGNAWDHCLTTSNANDYWYGTDLGNAAAVGDLDLTTVNQFTITMWVKRGGNNNTDLLNIGSTANPTSGSNPGISVGLNGSWDNGIRVGVNGHNGYVGDLWSPGRDSDWVFLAIAYDGTDTDDVWNNETMNGLYGQNRNLAIITGKTSTPASVANGMNLHVGDYWTPTGTISLGATATAYLATDGSNANGFAGNMDDVRIYNGLLTVAQIEEIRQDAFAEPLPPINLYWKGDAVDTNWTSSNWTSDIAGTLPGTPPPNDGSAGVAFATTDAAPATLGTVLDSDQNVKAIVVLPGSGLVSISGDHSLTLGENGIWLEQTAGGLIIDASGGVTLSANQTWKNKSPNPFLVFSDISGSGTLTKSGFGALRLGGDNLLRTGGTVVEQGILTLDHVNALGAASASLAMNGGTVDINGFDVTLGTFSGNNGAVVQNSSSTPCALTLDVSTDTTYACSINHVTGAEPLSLVKKGSANVTASGASSFTGSVSIENGQFIANYPNYGGAPTSSSLGNVQVAGRTITVTLPGTLALTNNNIFGNANANPLLLPEIIVNQTVMSATNYNLIGNVTLNAAILSQTAGNSGNYQGYQFKGDVTVTGTIGASTISGSVPNHLSSNTVFNVADVTGDASGDLIVSTPLINQSGDFATAPAGLTKTGAGTMVLGGSNTYTGATKVLGGVLSLASATLSDTAAVEIAAGGAVLDLSHGATDTVAALKIGTQYMPAGIYGPEGSGAQFERAEITGSGFLDVIADSYIPWIDGFTTLSGQAAAKSADPDKDGLTNFQEFAFDGNPQDGAATGKMRSRVETVGAEQALVITLPVRNGAVFSGATPASAILADENLTYQIGGTNDLVTFDQSVSEVVPALSSGLPALDSGWSYRTFRLDGDVGARGPKGFLRATVVNSAP